MLYVEEKSFNKQLELINDIYSDSGAVLVIWIYPERDLTELIGLKLISPDYRKITPVTTYELGVRVLCTEQLTINNELIELIKNNENEISSNSDSLCVYSLEGGDWEMCTIGHEGMGLVKDDLLYERIRGLKLNVSHDAPSWW